MYTKDDVLAYVEDEGVKFIRVACFDLHGRQKNVSVMPGQLARVFDKGITIDGTQFFYAPSLPVDDLILKPDPQTMSTLPWRSMENGVIHMISRICYPDGSDYEGDLRETLRRIVFDLHEAGVEVLMASKFQFYLFERDEKGHPTRIPFDNGGYMDVAPKDRGENIRREICLLLEEMGLDPHKSYHQIGPGQNEIDFHCADALSAADDASLFRWVVETCAANNGLAADFTPCPLEDCPGSALHIQARLIEGSARMREAFFAGLLAHLPEVQVFFNPVAQSYKRLSHASSPSRADWSATKRNVMLRKPPLGDDVIEVRLADSNANPYLTFGLVLACGLAGIKENLTLDQVEAHAPCDLASSLEDSLDRMRNSTVLEPYYPASVVNAFLEEEPSC